MEMEMEMTNSGLLPAEITIDILSRLPVDSVIQCKRVCKLWRSFIDHDPTFLELHTHRFIISSSSSSSGQLIKFVAAFGFFLFVTYSDRLSRTNYDFRLHFGEYHDHDDAKNKKKNISSVKLSNKSIPNYPFHPFTDNFQCISSCNGLVLIASIFRDDSSMFVFNPVTREHIHLPPEKQEEEEEEYSLVRRFDSMTSTGFGYHPLINEYKVVRITYFRNPYSGTGNEGDYDISVYTLGSGRWRRRRESKYSVGYLNKSVCVFDCPGVLLNGVLYWIAISVGVIVSFDLADEELKILPLPPDYHNPILWDDDINLHLGVLGGCLCLSITSILHFDAYKSTVDIWVLLNKEEEEYSASYWTKKFSISVGVGGLHGKYELIAALESGKILFSRYHDRRLHLVSYDPETGNVHDEDESFHGHLNGWSDMIPYVKSFVSLKALGEEDAKYALI